MTITQRLDVELAPMRPAVGLAGLLVAVVQQARHAASELWVELRQWG